MKKWTVACLLGAVAIVASLAAYAQTGAPASPAPAASAAPLPASASSIPGPNELDFNSPLPAAIYTPAYKYLPANAQKRVLELRRMALEKKAESKAAFLKALSDSEPLARRYAIYGLERIGDASAGKDLVPLLKDSDRFVRRAAASALGKFKTQEAVAPLTDALAADDLQLRVEALETLGRIGDPSIQPAVLKALQDKRLWKELNPWDIHRTISIFSRKFWTDKGAVEVLKGLLNFKDMGNAEVAAATTPDRKEAAILQVTNAAAEILATKFADASGEDALIAGVASSDDYMQQSSSEALGLLKSHKAVPAIAKLLNNEWMATRRRAIRALGEIGDPAAVPELEKLIVGSTPPPPAPPEPRTQPASRPVGGMGAGPRPARPLPVGEPDARIRVLAAEMLQKIDGKKRSVDANDPAAALPQIADADLRTPGNKRPPLFLCLGVDDCANLEGLESMVDICETLQEKGSKAVFTLWLAPLASGYKDRDVVKQTLLIQRLFDLGCEIANHTLMHNPGGIYWTARPKVFQVEMIEGAARWYRENIDGFTRPFTFKGGGGASGTAVDPQFSQQLMVRQRFLYWGSRGRGPNQQTWPQGGQETYRLDCGCLDAAAPPVHANITDPIHSDYSGRFDYEVPEGMAMWKSNVEFHYAHPRRPIVAVNAFHDWGLKRGDGESTKGSHRNEGAILKAFLLDVLVTNKDKYPEAHCVTFRQVIEYVLTDGDLAHTLKAGNCQDSRNKELPKVE